MNRKQSVGNYAHIRGCHPTKPIGRGKEKKKKSGNLFSRFFSQQSTMCDVISLDLEITKRRLHIPKMPNIFRSPPPFFLFNQTFTINRRYEMFSRQDSKFFYALNIELFTRSGKRALPCKTRKSSPLQRTECRPFERCR